MQQTTTLWALAFMIIPSQSAHAQRQQIELELKYSVLVASYESGSVARAAQRRWTTPAEPWFVVPVTVRGEASYRVFAGHFSYRQDAESLLSRLIARGIVTSGDEPRRVHVMNQVVNFGKYPSALAADDFIQWLELDGVHAYRIGASQPVGAYHVYAGGYEDRYQMRMLHELVRTLSHGSATIGPRLGKERHWPTNVEHLLHASSYEAAPVRMPTHEPGPTDTLTRGLPEHGRPVLPPVQSIIDTVEQPGVREPIDAGASFRGLELHIGAGIVTAGELRALRIPSGVRWNELSWQVFLQGFFTRLSSAELGIELGIQSLYLHAIPLPDGFDARGQIVGRVLALTRLPLFLGSFVELGAGSYSFRGGVDMGFSSSLGFAVPLGSLLTLPIKVRGDYIVGRNTKLIPLSLTLGIGRRY